MFWLAHVTGGMAGSLFLRSLERSDRVYAAMVSRGYSGNLPSVGMYPIDKRGKTILLLGIFIFSIILVLGLLTGG
jgi:cobalt/nickel transport system permease protein